ncbi:hypothetical protein PWT90_01296 [Aphanocladium album]|nr:hypothetical protein PWT90_01296 [Aphanocladium album]
MEHLYKLYTAARCRRGGSSRARDEEEEAASRPPSLQRGDSSDATLTTQTELSRQQLPRQPPSSYTAHNSFLGNGSNDDIAIKPRKLTKLGTLTRIVSAVGGQGGTLSTSSGGTAAAQQGKTGKGELLDHFLTLPPELQLKVLSYLDFGDIERLRRTCRFFRAQVSPQLVRTLLAPHFEWHVRSTCRLCLKQQYENGGTALVVTDRHDGRFPFSSRCVECVWKNKEFDVGRKYLMASNVAVFVCRWCGRPVTSHPAWNQPEFHKTCFKRYTQIVFLYYLIGLSQWAVVLIASGMCWRYFPSRSKMVVGIVTAGFIVTLWNFCLNAVRGTIMRTYHVALLLESLIFASWFAPLMELLRIGSHRQPRSGMGSYEVAMLVFIIFNLVFRGINIVGNSILVCEYKLWRHKKPQMSPARSVWIHTIELFIFFVEPQCVEQEYPPKWWFTRPRVPRNAGNPGEGRGPEIVGVTPGQQQPGVGPYILDTDHNNLPVP